LRAGRKNVENQLAAIEHLETDNLFEIARLGGRKIVVEHDHVGIRGRRKPLKLFRFAAAKIRGHIGRFAPLRQRANHAGTGRSGQTFQFVQRVLFG
jgi:hypothetical protein